MEGLTSTDFSVNEEGIMLIELYVMSKITLPSINVGITLIDKDYKEKISQQEAASWEYGSSDS